MVRFRVHRLLFCLSSCLCVFVVGSAARAAPGTVTALAFSPDGKRLAVGTYGQAVLFDTAAWQPTAAFRKVEDTVRALAWSPDGHTLAIGSGLPARDGKGILWEPDGGAPPRTLPAQADAIESICFRSDGKELLVGADDNKVRLFRQLTDPGTVLDEHNDRVEAVAFSPKPDYIFVTGAMDKIVKVWDAKTGHTVVNFDQAAAGITGLAFLLNGDQFVGSSLDGQLRWWGVGYNSKKQTWAGYHFRTVEAHPGGVLALAISRDGRRLITGGMDNGVNVWDANSGGKIKEFKEPTQPVYAASLSPDGKIAAAGGREGVVWIWDVDAGKLLQTLALPALPTPAPALRPALNAPHRSAQR